MNTTARLAAYGATVVLLGAGAFATGRAVEAPTDHLDPAAQTASHAGAHPPASGPPPVAADVQPAGLTSSAAGYTLVPVTSTLPSATPTELAFRILGPDGTPLTAFDVSHEKRMHLILVRTDTASFQHLHPAMSVDGTWRTPVRLPAGGTYRAFADFVPGDGRPTTLSVDLFAPGQFSPAAPTPSRTATTPGGYQVTLTGDLTPGRAADVTLTVTRHGRPVTDLQPYLGAYGHLVALRSGDLGYLHVHPEGAPGDGATAPGPGITFHTEVPTAGTYRLFLDFRHGGAVRTAQFTVPTGATAAGSTATPPASPDPAGDGHTHGGQGHR